MTIPQKNSAESNFRNAFSRLKSGKPTTLPMGTPVTQNNIAREAGKDPSALRKSRFPRLIAEIQNCIAQQRPQNAPSERQRLIKQRKRSRDVREANEDLRMQRDQAATLLLEANARISLLTLKVQDLEARMEERHPKASITKLAAAKGNTSPRLVDKPKNS